MTDTPNPTAAVTDDEQDLVKRSAFSAIALVSRADPGFFAMFKESMAGSRAFAAAPPGVQELLRGGGFPTPPRGTPEQIEAATLADLASAVQILETKDPEHAQGFKDVVLAAADQVAGASDGVAAEEEAVIAKIRSALGAAGGSAAAAAEAPQLPDAGTDAQQQA